MREILGGVNEGGIPRKWGIYGSVVVCCSVLQCVVERNWGYEGGARNQPRTLCIAPVLVVVVVVVDVDVVVVVVVVVVAALGRAPVLANYQHHPPLTPTL